MSCEVTGFEKGGPPRAGRLGAADWLSLAASPTFAVMALVIAVGGPGPLDRLCSGASPLGGMMPMYLLMSAFHAAPWLRAISRALRHQDGLASKLAGAGVARRDSGRFASKT